ncbi:MAG: hypothetical protein ACREIH_10365, partial [Nitrospiraceae bacterium]
AKRKDGAIMVRNQRSYKAWMKGMAANDWIGWPVHDVFDYDEAVYQKLRALYEQGRREELEREWMNLAATASCDGKQVSSF